MEGADAVSARQRVVGAGSWRILVLRGVQRGWAAADELRELAAQKFRTLADPRARMLRRRRRALRWGLMFGAACVFWGSVTALLASWVTPVWVLLITGLVSAGAAFPMTLLLLRYRRLRSQPLPAERPGTIRRLPPAGSAARPVMFALGTSERGFFSLLGVMERGGILPADEIRGLGAAARRSAAAMSTTAAEVASMEQAVHATPESRPYLVPTINAFTTQLTTGVRQYNEMVTAAAHVVSSANGASSGSSGSAPPTSRQRYRDELAEATDRLLGWVEAFDELGGLPRGG